MLWLLAVWGCAGPDKEPSSGASEPDVDTDADADADASGRDELTGERG